MDQWMRSLPDSILLSHLSIPGTHNSPTYHRALPTVRCQAVSPSLQLQHGIRFLDIRARVDHPSNPRSDSLTLVHAVFPISLCSAKSNNKFRPLFNIILSFLATNPTETIILSLKREGTGPGTDTDLARKLHDHYLDSAHWVMQPGVPTLGVARGKIVLLRRFVVDKRSREVYGHACGIDAEVWSDNARHCRAGDVLVQDVYRVRSARAVERKIRFVREHFERVRRGFGVREGGGASGLDVMEMREKEAEGEGEVLAMNFLSGSNLWSLGCWPESIARRVNPAVAQYLREIGKGLSGRGVGVMVCDWVGVDGDWDLVEAIVALNAHLVASKSLRTKDM